jgi:probable HAF family extracellular repeat protein
MMYRTAVRAGVLLALSLAPLVTAGHAQASSTQRYNMVDIGTLGGTDTTSRSITNNGQIVGTSQVRNGRYDAFLYARGKMKDIGHWTADDINSAGEVVGTYTDDLGVMHGIIWKPGGYPRELDTLGGQYGGVFAINQKGDVVGVAQTTISDSYKSPFGGLCNSRACRGVTYPPDATGPAHDLGALSGGQSWALDINDKGVEGGWATTSAKSPFGGQVQYPVLFSAGRIIREPMPAYSGEVESLNDHGVAVGVVDSKRAAPGGGGGPKILPAEWRNGRLTMLPIAANGGKNDEAYVFATNNSGVAVGFSGYPCGNLCVYIETATIWTGGKAINLGNRVPRSSFTLYRADDINDEGQIVVDGDTSPNTNNGIQHSFLLTPCSGSSCKPFDATAIKPQVGPHGRPTSLVKEQYQPVCCNETPTFNWYGR